MSRFQPFEMERWQSIYENQVTYNLSESGVHPLTLRELQELSGARDIADTLIGYGQSNGTLPLRAAIARLYGGCDVDQVVVTNGSAEANFIALWELLEPGDEIAIVVPTYMQTYGLAQNLGITVREIWLHESANWQPDPTEIAAAVNERTRIIVVTNPNNPTGALLSTEARAAIVRAADRTGAWILADEVYTGAEIDGPETPSMFGEYDRVIATGSLSKAYGLPGLRVGWAVAPRELADRLWARKDYITIGPGELTDRLATIALDPAVRPKIIDRTRQYLRSGLATTEEWLRTSGVFTYVPPRAGAIMYARYELPVNSSELAERLRVDHSVLVVPGDHFAMDGYVRIGFGLEKHRLEHALTGFSNCLNSLAINPLKGTLLAP